MDVDRLWPFQLTRGHSKDPSKGACLLDAVSWFEDGCLNDKPGCVSPVLARLGHLANDVLDDTRRQELRRFIPRLVGTVDQEADRRRISYLLFVCEEFARRWDHAPVEYYTLGGKFLFWVEPTVEARNGSPNCAELLTRRLYYAHSHVRGVHQWIDRSELPSLGSFLSKNPPVIQETAKVNRITAQQDVERIAIDLLDVCCAIGAPQADWDFSRVPAAVERFRKAREAV